MKSAGQFHHGRVDSAPPLIHRNESYPQAGRIAGMSANDSEGLAGQQVKLLAKGRLRLKRAYPPANNPPQSFIYIMKRKRGRVKASSKRACWQRCVGCGRNGLPCG